MRITISLPDEVYKKLVSECERRNLSKSNYVSRFLFKKGRTYDGYEELVAEISRLSSTLHAVVVSGAWLNDNEKLMLMEKMNDICTALKTK